MAYKISSSIPPPTAKVVRINDALKEENKRLRLEVRKVKGLLKRAIKLIPISVRDDRFFQDVDDYILDDE